MASGDDRKLRAAPKQEAEVPQSVGDLVAALRGAEARMRELRGRQAKLRAEADALDLQVTEQNQEIKRIENALLVAARGRE